MRHRIRHRKLNRTSEHRKALRQNLAQSLFEHGQVKTTLAKAKDLRPFCEKLISLAVKSRKLSAANDHAGALSARRGIHQLLGDRGIIAVDHRSDYAMMSDASRERTLRMSSGRRHRSGEPKGRLAFTAESVTHRLIERVAARFEDRPGGYTRVIRLSRPRLGDCSPQAILQLVGDEEAPGAITKAGKTSRRRRADARYALAIKVAKEHSAKGPTSDDEAPPEIADSQADETATEPEEEAEPDAKSEQEPE